MRYHELIEHNIIPDPKFKMPDFSKAQQLDSGFPISDGRKMEIWAFILPDQRLYGLVDPSLGPDNPISFIGLERENNMWIAKNALTSDKHRGEGIILSLFYYLTKYEGLVIISDSEVTKEGENLWKRLIKSPQFNSSIYNIKTGEEYHRKPEDVMGSDIDIFYKIQSNKFSKKRVRDSLIQESVTFVD